jgi:DNA-binding MarR family transcriptional regulator
VFEPCCPTVKDAARLTAQIRVYTLIAMSAPSSRSLPPELHVCRDCHCLAARKRARAITRLYEEKLRPHGLRATQYSILAALGLKGATPVGELADLLGLERTSLTRSAQVVERNGWISAEESDDGRERPLRITERGLDKLLAAFPDWKEAQDMVDRGWPEGHPPMIPHERTSP